MRDSLWRCFQRPTLVPTLGQGRGFIGPQLIPGGSHIPDQGTPLLGSVTSTGWSPSPSLPIQSPQGFYPFLNGAAASWGPYDSPTHPMGSPSQDCRSKQGIGLLLPTSLTSAGPQPLFSRGAWWVCSALLELHTQRTAPGTQVRRTGAQTQQTRGATEGRGCGAGFRPAAGKY